MLATTGPSRVKPIQVSTAYRYKNIVTLRQQAEMSAISLNQLTVKV